MDILLNPADFHEETARLWVKERQKAAAIICVVYLVVIFSLKRYMHGRPALELKKPLRLWNFFLALFSIAGTFSISPEFFETIQNHGFVGKFVF